MTGYGMQLVAKNPCNTVSMYTACRCSLLVQFATFIIFQSGTEFCHSPQATASKTNVYILKDTYLRLIQPKTVVKEFLKITSFHRNLAHLGHNFLISGYYPFNIVDFYRIKYALTQAQIIVI